MVQDTALRGERGRAHRVQGNILPDANLISNRATRHTRTPDDVRPAVTGAHASPTIA